MAAMWQGQRTGLVVSTAPLRDHLIDLSTGSCVYCGESSHRIQAHPEMKCNQPRSKLMSVRAKFKCMDKSEPDQEGCSTIRMEPVYCGSEENKQFFRWTPGGQISLSTINPAAAQQFEVGKEYYVDFNEAPFTEVPKAT